VKIITSDIIDLSTNPESPLIDREGQLLLDNVEVANCSDEGAPAVKFEGALERPSRIMNSVIHSGKGWGL